MSRTFPLATCVTSGTDGLPVGHEIAEASEDDVGTRREGAEVEHLVQIDPRADTRVGSNELAKVQTLVPRTHRMALNQPVRGVALESRLDEREKNALAEEERARRVEVCAHALRANDETIDQPREPVEHVVDGEERIRQGHALRRGVRDVPFVPEGDVLEADERITANQACDPADALRHDRVALVGHRGRALLAPTERLLDLAHLGPSEMANLEREPLQRRSEERQGREEIGMSIALDDLSRARRRLEPESFAGQALDLGRRPRI